MENALIYQVEWSPPYLSSCRQSQKEDRRELGYESQEGESSKLQDVSLHLHRNSVSLHLMTFNLMDLGTDLLCKNCGTSSKMQMQLTFAILLILVSNGLCSDIDQGKRTIEEEVLRSLLTSKAKSSKPLMPLWQLPLQDVCRILNGLGGSWGSEEQQEDTETQTDYEQRVSGTLAEVLHEMHELQSLCRVMQPRELLNEQEYLDLDQTNDSPLKRKSPYILKRQLRTNKSRRPYILKRSVYY
ncbi:hypothetical protein DNTS_007063 [Danionella cerebrum]|uniref:Neurotensin/neuromedin N n=1 Tax=Danionella cerebrum TaxID=2873325 RepID=A0A553QQL9_9TELE|nr:hypothetical protein DNTS_007063 [Danionella translucida]